MAFADRFNHLLSIGSHALGEQVGYKKPSELLIYIQGTVSYPEKTEETQQNTKQTAKIVISKADVPSPQYQDEVIIRDVAWKVEFIKDLSAQYWEIELRSKAKQKF